ncbi:MAG: hypothetical protein INR68_08895 [Methylobacterium mesophilicum]|nr:hypothetical protein [Methylobacterium mesophilicum]
MTKIVIIAGDWPSGTDVTYAPGFFGKPSSILIGWTGGRFYAEHIASAEHVTEQNSTSVLGKVGWGAVGSVALGPVGLLAGLVAGGKRQHTIVALELVDGRKALLKCDQAGFEAVMKASHKPAPPVVEDTEWVKSTPEYRFINGIAKLFGRGDKTEARDHVK